MELSPVPDDGSLQRKQKENAIKALMQAPFRPPRVLFCLDLKNPLRNAYISIVEWKYPFLVG